MRDFAHKAGRLKADMASRTSNNNKRSTDQVHIFTGFYVLRSYVCDRITRVIFSLFSLVIIRSDFQPARLERLSKTAGLLLEMIRK